MLVPILTFEEKNLKKEIDYCFYIAFFYVLSDKEIYVSKQKTVSKTFKTGRICYILIMNAIPTHVT